MKKILSKILISVIMVALFLAPISGGIKINDKAHLAIVKVEINTAKAGEIADTNTNYSLGCSIFDGMDGVVGCVSGILYVVWQASALVAMLGGKFLDFLVYYSTNSSSYSNKFVEEGWGIVRDIANMFFIIALLYIAIKTILGLNVTNNKKLISAVIIVALVINFSLLTTRVVIDASNVVAKIFYNGMTSAPGPGGEKTISVTLINSYNPQQIISEPVYNDDGRGMFIFVTILLIVLTLYTAYVFFAVALLFVGRVVSLWLSMIFSPLAFASYTLPFEVPGFGHKEWWKNLAENAMLAPLFIFMLYIIIRFSKILSEIVTYQDSTTISTAENAMQHMMKVVIPFAILFMLLMQAKKLATKYAGEMGAAMNKAGAMVGGLALGAATGGAAMVASNTAGRAARNVANNDELKAKAAAGDKGAQRKLAIANSMAKSSFDFRQTGIGKGFSKMAGMDLNKGTGLIGMSTEKLKGGRKERDKEEAKKHDDIRKTYMLSKSGAEKQDNREKEYKADKEKAEKPIQEQDARAKKYSEDKAKARKFTNDNGASWDESKENDFKTKYENGEDLGSYGIYEDIKSGSVEKGAEFDEEKFKKAYENKDLETLKSFGIDKEKEYKEKGTKEEFKSGSVKSSKDLNDERQKAYALSLDNPGKKIEDGKAIKKGMKDYGKDFASSFGSGMKDPKVLVATAAATALGGPLGLLTPVIGGLSYAIKDLVKAQAQRIPGLGVHKDIAASVRAGVKDSKEEAWHHMQEAFGGGHGDEHKKEEHGGEVKKEHKAEHTEEKHEEHKAGDEHHAN